MDLHNLDFFYIIGTGSTRVLEGLEHCNLMIIVLSSWQICLPNWDLAKCALINYTNVLLSSS